MIIEKEKESQFITMVINKNQEDIYPEDNFPKDSEEYPHDTIVE